MLISEQASDTKGEDIQQICTFRIAGYLYGVNIRYVKEINQELHISPVPHSPANVKGLVNIRGEVYLIFDLRNCFGFPPIMIDEHHRIILFKSDEMEFSGILVDSLQDVIRVQSSLIETYNPEVQMEGLEMLRIKDAGIGQNLVQGVFQFQKEIMIILNPMTLLQFE
ncbi:MAG: purine-binding chemotaxis protein CheW [SAR324 cluster bacterium]|nr:purine-binding chemotaxis protein CheW [SAR324 cluster bacterium]